MGRKRTWYTRPLKYVTSMVGWNCVPLENVTRGGSDTWVRKVYLRLNLDGREIDTYLTPGEARSLAVVLMRQANRVDEMNTEMGNGGNYNDEQDWAVSRSLVAGTPDAPRIDWVR